MLNIDVSLLKGARVLVGVSGGADSVALLCLLVEKLGSEAVIAAHFEHGIRGEDSLRDMEFVEALCDRLGVRLIIGRGNVPDAAARTGEGLEACARRLRHEFLKQAQLESHADVIAVAHHQRDLAETVLMHILRGSGINGAGAMQGGHIVRPLINVTPEEIREYLASIGQEFREDYTNFIPDNPRNALRLNVFPELKKIYPGFERALARFSELSACDCDYIRQQANALVTRHFMGVFSVSRNAHTALLRRAVRDLIHREASFTEVETALSCTGYADLSRGYRAFGAEDAIYIIQPLPPTVYTFTLTPCAPVPIKNNGLVQVLAGVEDAQIRLRRDGDYICPLGMRGKRKLLSDYFTDKKYPVPLRDRLPLLARKNEILWVPGLGISENARVGGDAAAYRAEIKFN